MSSPQVKRRLYSNKIMISHFQMHSFALVFCFAVCLPACLFVCLFFVLIAGNYWIWMWLKAKWQEILKYHAEYIPCLTISSQTSTITFTKKIIIIINNIFLLCYLEDHWQYNCFYMQYKGNFINLTTLFLLWSTWPEAI